MEGTHLYCPHCRTFIPDHPDQIRSHLWGKRHLGKTLQAQGHWQAELLPTNNGDFDRYYQEMRYRRDQGRLQSGYYKPSWGRVLAYRDDEAELMARLEGIHFTEEGETQFGHYPSDYSDPQQSHPRHSHTQPESAFRMDDLVAELSQIR